MYTAIGATAWGSMRTRQRKGVVYATDDFIPGRLISEQLCPGGKRGIAARELDAACTSMLAEYTEIRDQERDPRYGLLLVTHAQDQEQSLSRVPTHPPYVLKPATHQQAVDGRLSTKLTHAQIRHVVIRREPALPGNLTQHAHVNDVKFADGFWAYGKVVSTVQGPRHNQGIHEVKLQPGPNCGRAEELSRQGDVSGCSFSASVLDFIQF
jgi:hypothetical protein